MMFLTILAIAIASCLLCWLHWRWTHRRILKLATLIPGPPALPILGNALIFIARLEEQLNLFDKVFSKYGEYSRVWLGRDMNVIVKNPADIRMLLTSNKLSQKGPLYEFLKPFIGPGILTGGPTWRNHRKILTPSYNKKSVQRYIHVFNAETEELARKLSCKDPKETFDVYFDVVHCTTQSVCQTLLGLSKNDAKSVNRMNEVVLNTQAMYTFMFTKMVRWWLQIPLVFRLLGNKEKERFYIKMVEDMTSDLVSKRRRAMDNSIQNAESIVDRCILSGDMSDHEIKWEIFTVFTTSQEASAKIASAVLLILAHMQDWQVSDKVYNEIIEILGPDDDFVTYEQLKRLQYLDMVFKETLRYVSIAAFVQRTVEEDVTINEGKLTLPAGVSVLFPIHLLHRDPKYWEDPYKVKPERFLPENMKKRDPNAFIPFSLGAMDCIGRTFATSLIKILVVRVLRRVRLEADGRLEDFELHVAISVKFAKGYNMRALVRS